MQAAVMGVRLDNSVKKNSLWDFRNVFHLIDSKCTLGMLSKDSTSLKEYMGTRVSEIMSSANVEHFYHVDTSDNVSDIGREETRPYHISTQTAIGGGKCRLYIFP